MSVRCNAPSRAAWASSSARRRISTACSCAPTAPPSTTGGSVNKYGVDIGFTKEAHIVWLVFAPGAIGKGALAGDYGGVTAAVAVGVGVGANVLVGGSSKQITLQPVSVEGSVGLNVAAGVAARHAEARAAKWTDATRSIAGRSIGRRGG